MSRRGTREGPTEQRSTSPTQLNSGPKARSIFGNAFRHAHATMQQDLQQQLSSSGS